MRTLTIPGMFGISTIGEELAPLSVTIKRYRIDYEKSTLDIIRYNTQNPISSQNVPNGTLPKKKIYETCLIGPHQPSFRSLQSPNHLLIKTCKA